jgi:outer membrane protein TolC
MTHYSQGSRRSLELLEASRNDMAASRNAIMTQIDYFRAVARAFHAAGISPGDSGRVAGEELQSVISLLAEN